MQEDRSHANKSALLTPRECWSICSCDDVGLQPFVAKRIGTAACRKTWVMLPPSCHAGMQLRLLDALSQLPKVPKSNFWSQRYSCRAGLQLDVGSMTHVFFSGSWIRWCSDFYGSWIHWILDSSVQWFIASLTISSLFHFRWTIAFFLHKFNVFLLHWFVHSLVHCFIVSLIFRFVDSLIHRFISPFIGSFSQLCMDSFSCHVIGISTTICSSVIGLATSTPRSFCIWKAFL